MHLQNEGRVTELRQRTVDFFAKNAAASVLSERHTTELLELIVSSGCRSANQASHSLSLHYLLGILGFVEFSQISLVCDSDCAGVSKNGV